MISSNKIAIQNKGDRQLEIAGNSTEKWKITNRKKKYLKIFLPEYIHAYLCKM